MEKTMVRVWHIFLNKLSDLLSFKSFNVYNFEILEFAYLAMGDIISCFELWPT
jgi:hypothetical protein